MARSFRDLTADQLVRGVRRDALMGLIFDGFGLLFAGAMLAWSIWALAEAFSFWGLFMFAVGLLLLVYLVKDTAKHGSIFSDPERCRLFQKYGDPDTLAQLISDHCDNTLLESKQILVTDQFIMKRNQFESLIVYEKILLLYRKEHRTNGILDGVYLVIHDAYGDSYEYPFKLGKKHVDEFHQTAAEIANRAPNCRVGYTKENLTYVKENQLELGNRH